MLVYPDGTEVYRATEEETQKFWVSGLRHVPIGPNEVLCLLNDGHTVKRVRLPEKNSIEETREL